jgi:hypothetical protein
VLTDGSEYTAHGTIFLSVWKRPHATAALPSNREQQRCDNATLLLTIVAIVYSMECGTRRR